VVYVSVVYKASILMHPYTWS